MSGHTSRQSQHLLRTLFGDYWLVEGAVAPAGALAEMLDDYGISVAAARAALRRSAQKGLLAPSKVGRTTHYGLSPEGRESLTEVWHRLVEFGTVAQEWDGRWTCVVFSVPEQHRDQRHRLRNRLRWLGFAPLYDGVWVCPRVVDDRLRAMIAELGIGAATVFVGTEAGSGTDFGRALDAWDLDAVRAECEGFVELATEIEQRTLAGLIAPAEALRLRTEVTVRWIDLLNDVPDLPAELLPADWPAWEARRAWGAVYDGLRTLALYRVRHIVGEHAPDLVDHIVARAADAASRGPEPVDTAGR